MPPSLADLVKRIREKHFAYPPADRTEINSARVRGVPEDLLALYALCDGALIGDGDDFSDPKGRRYRLRIPALADLTTTQSYGYIFEDSPLFNQSAKWWQMVDYGDANWLAVDGSSNVNGGVIDIFHETVGELGSHERVANSLPDLLDRLLRCDGVYWFDDDFQSLGAI